METARIREKFKEFFKERGHAWVPSSSLVPDDPSVLLTTAGMQQFKKYYTGERDPLADFKDAEGKPTRNAASIQKSFRTSDIDEVGDESHLTFFEMLGNFSFGGYFKKEAIRYGYDFITNRDWMGLEIEYVTVFDPAKVAAEDWRKSVPFDEESYRVWKEEIGLPEAKIRRAGADNFWGPTGTEGPCGPTTEIYLKDAQGKAVEIWNIVFNEYYCSADRKLAKLGTPGVDTGMGFERLAMVSQGAPTIFETDLFAPIMETVPGDLPARERRIVADHARAIAFLVSDGVRPSNKGAGYVLRRLMRRAIYETGSAADAFIKKTLSEVVEQCAQSYPSLDRGAIIAAMEAENEKFQKTLATGLKELRRIPEVGAPEAFKLYESYGLPFEVIKRAAGDRAKGLSREAFDDEFEKHRAVSRAGAEKKFGGHGLLLDTGELKAGNEEEMEKVLRLHTATHLLQRALRETLGAEVRQMGSDITPERTRFDFSFPRKMTLEEIERTEALVNEKIKEDLPVAFEEMPKAEAERLGALHFFKERYPDKVKVYYVGRDLASAWSREFCGGPHVAHTGAIGRFRIAKEEAVGAGVRRIRGIVE